MSDEKRKHPRFDSLNLSYIWIDDNGTPLEQSMGRTLNVSESGLCLETHFNIKTTHHLILTIALEDDLVEVQGDVAYCRPGAVDMFETGVEFTDMEPQAKKVYKKYVKFFYEQQGQM